MGRKRYCLVGGEKKNKKEKKEEKNKPMDMEFHPPKWNAFPQSQQIPGESRSPPDD